tara:strand:- start:15636 stop:15977 length:342 start_codon:yes stop_codon:yes gene_type:complete
MTNSYNKGLLRIVLIYSIIFVLFILIIDSLFIKREGHGYDNIDKYHYDEHQQWHKGKCGYQQSERLTGMPIHVEDLDEYRESDKEWIKKQKKKKKNKKKKNIRDEIVYKAHSH